MEELLNYCKTLHLLYVEDNEEARRYTLEMLKRFFDKITVACNGEEGLQKFKEGQYDLIITDINMPKMDGLEMISNIRIINQKILILVLSAHNESNYYEDAHSMHVNGYLPKPMTLQQIIYAFNELFANEHK